MITSLLDNDLYKFTMQNAVVKMFPRAKVRYHFFNRGKTPFPDGFAEELRKEIHKIADLHLSKAEKDFLAQACPYLDATYLDFLAGYRFNTSEVGVIQRGGELQVSVEGYWYRTILWEVPLMAMISELYFRMTKQSGCDAQQAADIVKRKMARYKMIAAPVADFGTRRRFSFANHNLVVESLKNYGGQSLIGTSNVFFAMKYNLRPIGTHAHEWFMFHSAKYGYKIANQTALDSWIQIYNGELGVALTDTFTTNKFFEAFDSRRARIFDGVRQDSGDPFEFTDKLTAHYKRLGIDPLSKTIVFSDSLNPELVEKLGDYCRNKIRASFGIGTNFTNDVGVTPLNIVVKLTEVKPEENTAWTGVVKLSDTAGKHTGEPSEIELCKRTLNIVD